METNKNIYWLNKDSLTFLERGYLLPDESPESRMRAIAERAQELLDQTGFADKFESYLHAGFYSLSSPIWSNFGRDRGLPISCFGSYIPDTMSGIFGKLSEVAMMTKAGGGTSGYFGDIRPRGSEISSGGTSTGAVHFMELYDKTMAVVSQGSVRRGSFAAYLPIDHGDIEEFLQIKGDGNSIQDLSIGVTISDEWMQSMIDGDKQKRKIWGLVIKKRFESGYPYLFFSDTANESAPQAYKDQGLKINNSNLCLVGETLVEVSTDSNGQDSFAIRIDNLCDLYNSTSQYMKYYVKSYDTNSQTPCWSQISAAAYTGKSYELIEVIVADGESIQCTPKHKIWTTNRGWVEAQNLICDDILVYNMKPVTGCLTARIQLSSPVPVYDITVPETESFLANNIVVHNCNEIYLSNDENNSFVCNLSSINLERWDELKDTDAIETLVAFLDAVMTEFIEKTADMPYMSAPRNFASQQRALGIGVLGYHTYLQSKGIPFEGLSAHFENINIFKTIRERCDKATETLAIQYGEPPLLQGYGRRNTTTMAVAPTTSSAFILGQVSPSIEPLNSNYFVKDLSKGKFTYKNPHLKMLLKSKGQNTPEVWKDILVHGGSVQHLTCLTPEEKAVYKTFGEISQKEIIIQAHQRQKYIDQGQSLNVMIPPLAKPKEVSELYIQAWKLKLKGLYYQRSANPAQELARRIMTCASCEA